MSDPQLGSHAKPTIDENEDLFSFDELTEPATTPVATTIAPASGGAHVFSNLNEEAMTAVLGPSSATSAPVSIKPVSAVAASVSDSERVVGPAGSMATTTGTRASTDANAASPRAKLDWRGSPILVGALALFALANLALIGLTWKSMSSLSDALATRTQPARHVETETPTTHVGSEPAAPHIPARLEPRLEGEETLENARLALERGDFEGARRMLYGLLAVADRWEPLRRDDLEARATFLIGDSYRAQADARRAAPLEPASASHDDGAVHAAEREPDAHGGRE